MLTIAFNPSFVATGGEVLPAVGTIMSATNFGRSDIPADVDTPSMARQLFLIHTPANYVGQQVSTLDFHWIRIGR